MKTKILTAVAFVVFAAFFLTGCIIVNVEKNRARAQNDARWLVHVH